MYMKKITIYGERCSGTNYLEQLMILNFNVEVVWNYGWKHFFGFNDLSKSDDVLFIGIVRNLEDWLNSLYRERHHISDDLIATVDGFLNNPFYSINDDYTELMEDRHIETKERYKNIFELRKTKNKFLIETMPTKVKNYCLITYDDLCNNFKTVMSNFKKYGLRPKHNRLFPLQVRYYKADKTVAFSKKPNRLPRRKILEKMEEDKELMYYEKILFPLIYVSVRKESDNSERQSTGSILIRTRKKR